MKNEELINRYKGLEGIQTPKILPCKLKRIATKDGFGTLRNTSADTVFLVDLGSLRNLEVTNEYGITKTKLVINKVDSTGKSLGWIYAELFFD